jgi:hypothetical protein
LNILSRSGLSSLCADKLAFNKAILASDFTRVILPLYEMEARDLPYVVKNVTVLPEKALVSFATRCWATAMRGM